MAPSEGERAATLREVWDQLARLPADERIAVVLHAYEGCSLDEVAQATGVKKSTAQSRVQRGVEPLREALAVARCAFTGVTLEAVLRDGRSADRRLATPAAPRIGAIVARVERAALVATALKAIGALAVVAVIAAFATGGAPPPPGPGANGSARSTNTAVPTSGGGASSGDGSGVAPGGGGVAAALVVTVKDGSGRPVPGASVALYLLDLNEGVVFTERAVLPTTSDVQTDANGDATSPFGYAFGNALTELRDGRWQPITLGAGRRLVALASRGLDLGTSEVVEVAARGPSLTTDERGRFAIRDVPAGELEVTISPELSMHVLGRFRAEVRGGEVVERTLEVTPVYKPRGLRGRLVLPRGDGVRATGPRLAPGLAETSVDLGPLPAGRYRVVVAGGDAPPDPGVGVEVEVRAGETTDAGLLPIVGR